MPYGGGGTPPPDFGPAVSPKKRRAGKHKR
jgi:hypothetical protein